MIIISFRQVSLYKDYNVWLSLTVAGLLLAEMFGNKIILNSIGMIIVDNNNN